MKNFDSIDFNILVSERMFFYLVGTQVASYEKWHPSSFFRVSMNVKRIIVIKFKEIFIFVWNPTFCEKYDFEVTIIIW